MAGLSDKLLKLVDNKWVVMGRKHRGELLTQVAKEDPTYLQWIYRERFDNLEDAPFYALQDVMESNKIPLFEPCKTKVGSKNAPSHGNSLRR